LAPGFILAVSENSIKARKCNRGSNRNTKWSVDLRGSHTLDLRQEICFEPLLVFGFNCAGFDLDVGFLQNGAGFDLDVLEHYLCLVLTVLGLTLTLGSSRTVPGLTSASISMLLDISGCFSSFTFFPFFLLLFSTPLSSSIMRMI
jgi:hypothetical protein